MRINENNKDKIQKLAQIIATNPNSVNDCSFEIKNAEPYMEFLLESDNYPAAVDPVLIVRSEEDKVERAQGILQQIITESLYNTKFLDFGCGEGHVIYESTSKTQLSVGYDIKTNEKWVNSNNSFFTSEWKEVVEHGPYDVILIFDVLDHVENEEMAIECLRKAKEVLTEEGKIFVRFHPWCSRHSNHLYYQLNKAYVHMFFTNEQLKEMGYEPIPTLKLIHPLNTYKKWFEIVGLQSIYDKVTREEIEPFFSSPPVADLIKKHWKNSPDETLASGSAFPSYQLQQQFVDQILKKN